MLPYKTQRLEGYIHISDGSETAIVALWGPHAYKFDAEKYIAMTQQGPVALLFAGLTANWYEGQLRLQGSPTCTWYVNPALPEATSLQDSVGYMVGPAQWIGQPEEQAGGGQTTVAELSREENPHDIWVTLAILCYQTASIILAFVLTRGSHVTYKWFTN